MLTNKQIALKLISAYLSVNELSMSVERARSKFDSLSVNNDVASGSPSSSDPEVFQKDFMGKDESSMKDIEEWLRKADTQKDNIENFALDLNNHLKDKTYLVGNSATAADITAFAHVNSFMANASDETRANLNYFTRWFNLIQNIIPIDSIQAVGFNIVEINKNIKPQISNSKSDNSKELDKKSEVVSSNSAGSAQGVNEGKKDKQAKKEKKEKKPAAPKEIVPTVPSMIDLRVGRIVKVEKHPDADSLYVEQIDVGEAEPRTVVSGLVKYYTLEEMQNRLVIAVCNLKPAAMRGIKSYAMVLCASHTESGDAAPSKVEFIEPPTGSNPGDRASFDGFQNQEPEPLLNPKKKIWETIQPGFITSNDLEAGWTDASNEFHKLLVNGNACKSKSIAKGSMK
ncbi:hypothetical protein BB561_002406 [Smittium simulii]|uniref:tRNA-binding domain-containing protein n=1 Tax=Smittium simulii TaxID=133385 RepID=A0A2T9YQK5_9FUNG|nr:hypothetical protein BB561_002406 [Smittium simulii]